MPWVKGLTKDEKASIGATCERFIEGTLKPRFLPEVIPTELNYPVDISGKWRAEKYGFVVRYRSGFPHNRGDEFNQAFARLDHTGRHPGEARFDVMWHRHTRQWFRLYAAVTLEEALSLIETDGLLHPVV